MALSRAKGVLAEGTIAVVPLKGRTGPLYRARIVGLGKTEAEAACRTLKVARAQCMVLRMGDADRERQAASL